MADETKDKPKDSPPAPPTAPAGPQPGRAPAKAAPEPPRAIDETVPGGRYLVNSRMDKGVRVGGTWVDAHGNPVDPPSDAPGE